MVDKLLETEALRDGFPKINAAIDLANEANANHAATDKKADTAISTANEAKQKSDSTQTQLDQIVIEGDSSVEAAQARVDSEGTAYTTLKERLDTEHTDVMSSLAQTAKNFKSTIESESAQFGNELLDATGWTSTGWTGDFNNGFVHTVGEITPLVRNLQSTGTKMYQVSLTLTTTNIADVGGLFSVSIGGSQPFDTYKGSGSPRTYHFGIQSLVDGDLVITPVSELSGTISNISVKEILNPSTSTFSVKDSNDSNVLEGRFSTPDIKNVFLGSKAGQYTTTGDENIGIGDSSLKGNLAGFWNVAVGTNTLSKNTMGSRNVAIGRVSMQENITGHRNIAVGPFTLHRNTHGENNIAIGADSLWYNTTGKENVGVGYRTLAGNRTGTGNTAIGHKAGDSGDSEINTNGNTLIGSGAGGMLRTGGDFNTFIGRFAGSLTTTGKHNILIGVAVNAPTATTSNYLNIGNFIYGEMTAYNLSIGKAISNKGLGTGVKLQVGRTGYAGYLELLRSSNVNNEQVGAINFINEGNLGADANTRETISYISTEVRTSNTNANGNSGGRIKFFTKPENGGLAQRMVISENGGVGIGITNPTALLHLYPGSNVAGTAPLKFTEGTLNVVPEAGAVEFDGTNLYFTDKNGARRQLAVVS